MYIPLFNNKYMQIKFLKNLASMIYKYLTFETEAQKYLTRKDI